MKNSQISTSIQKLFQFYKDLGEKAIAQIDDEKINWRPNDASNSIALIVHHLSGNMLSRFTDFLTSDGEKPWRNRDAEFEVGYKTKAEMMEAWAKGWVKVFEVMDGLTEADLEKIIYIRNEGHQVMDALQRQLTHYAYHVGQILYIGKIIKGDEWKSLSVPKGHSAGFNAEKFQKEKTIRHFTDKG